MRKIFVEKDLRKITQICVCVCAHKLKVQYNMYLSYKRWLDTHTFDSIWSRVLQMVGAAAQRAAHQAGLARAVIQDGRCLTLYFHPLSVSVSRDGGL